MNFQLSNPEYLRNNRFHKCNEDIKENCDVGSYKVYFRKRDKNYVNNRRYSDDFRPENNSIITLIEYIEQNVMTLTTRGMPTLIFKDKNNFIKQENNIFSSFLNKPQKTRIVRNNDNDNIPFNYCDGKSGNKKKVLFIMTTIKPFGYCIVNMITNVLISCHTQPKMDMQVTFLKQERTKFLLKEEDCNHKYKKKRRRRKKKNDNRIESCLNDSPITNWRIHYVHEEYKKTKYFFKHIMNRYDANTLLITIYTLSCFPIHDSKMQKILKKITSFINLDLNWTKSINHGWLNNMTELGKNSFFLRYQRICNFYIPNEKIFMLDEYLKIYISELTKKEKIVGETHNETIKKKIRKWCDIKLSIINKIYELECIYMFNPGVICSIFEDYVVRKLGTTKETKVEINSIELAMDFSMANSVESEKINNFKYTEELKYFFIYKELMKEKYKKRKTKKKKNCKKKTMEYEIFYSEVLFKNSFYTIKIHPQIKKMFSDPLSVFKNFNKRKRI